MCQRLKFVTGIVFVLKYSKHRGVLIDAPGRMTWSPIFFLSPIFTKFHVVTDLYAETHHKNIQLKTPCTFADICVQSSKILFWHSGFPHWPQASRPHAGGHYELLSKWQALSNTWTDGVWTNHNEPRDLSIFIKTRCSMRGVHIWPQSQIQKIICPLSQEINTQSQYSYQMIFQSQISKIN